MTKRVTAADLLAKLENDPEFVARRKQQEQELQSRAHSRREEEGPLIADLNAAGCAVSSVWDLVNRADDYPNAIPTLLAHLDRPHSSAVREGIARALGTPSARAMWASLAARFESEHDERVKDGLAAALAAIADAAVLDGLVSLLNEPANGPSRVLLLRGLARIGDRRAQEALRALADDPVLSEEARFLLRTTRRK